MSQKKEGNMPCGIHKAPWGGRFYWLSSSEFRRSPTSEILYHIVYLPVSKGSCGKCMRTDTMRSKDAAMDVYSIYPLLFSRMDVKGNDHLEAILHELGITVITRNLHQHLCTKTVQIGYTPRSPTQRWCPHGSGDPVLKEIDISSPWKTSTGKLWWKFGENSQQKKGKSPQTCPQKDAKNLDGLFTSLYQAWLPFHVSPGSGRS